MAGRMVCVMWAVAASRTPPVSASRAGLSSASSATGSARYPASWRMEWSTPTAVGVRPSAASARYRWPSASRVAPIFDSLLRYRSTASGLATVMAGTAWKIRPCRLT